MPRRLITSLLLGLTASALAAQGIFTNANAPGDAICPRLMQDKTELNYKSQYGRNQADASQNLYTQKGDWLFPPA